MALAKIGSGDALDTDHSDFYLNLARPQTESKQVPDEVTVCFRIVIEAHRDIPRNICSYSYSGYYTVRAETRTSGNEAIQAAVEEATRYRVDVL